MVIYVEDVLAENFMLDCALLTLSLRAAKATFRKRNVLFSALFGAIFALFFPLLSLPVFCGFCLKICTGFFMCFLAFPHVKTKKQRGMYASICFFFFCFSFVFAGAIFTIFSQNQWQNTLQRLPFSFIFSAFVFLCLFARKAMAKLYEKKRVLQHVYSCAIPCNKRLVAISGFLDSGNKATKNNVPVCFISPVIAYEIWQDNLLDEEQKNDKEMGQVCDELTVLTVGGEKTFTLRLGELRVQQNKAWIKRQVYFAVSPHILSQAYDLLLPACILEDTR